MQVTAKLSTDMVSVAPWHEEEPDICNSCLLTKGHQNSMWNLLEHSHVLIPLMSYRKIVLSAVQNPL